jgi:hypothetical protein
MPTNAIVKAGDVLKDGTTRLLMGLKHRATETFAFERAEEALYDGLS